MSQSTINAVGQRLALLSLVSVIGITTVVFSQCHREASEVSDRMNESALAERSAMLEGTDLPQGKYCAEFATACMSCHSPRLALYQPRFPKKKWGEIVHKMVSVYGAPITKNDEPLIVEYLITVQAGR